VGLTVWTVYDHPSDYPNHWVARRWVVDEAGPTTYRSDVFVRDDLNELRDQLSRMGLFPLGRSPEDDPTIVETWL
jgi:hypothetical protein